MTKSPMVLAASMVLALLSILPAAQAQSTDYRSRTIYFLLTDRFSAHQPFTPYVDLEYPSATNVENCFETLCPAEEQWRKYWGGDIAGAIDKLDYLRDLGVGAVWLTPLMENVRAYEGGTAYGTGYHGYWIQNYYRVNAHFGQWDDVNALSSQLHARSMRYIQDITLNHSNPLDNHVFGRLYQSQSADDVFIPNYFNDFDSVTGMHYYKHYEWTQACKSAKTKGDSEWSYWQLHHCLLADLSGYNQHDPNMADYLIDAGKLWLDAGVDDFRLDAVKFPFPDFISSFTHEMVAHSEDMGREDPYIVGEWSGGGVGEEKSLRFANRYDHFRTNILDFSLALALNQFIGGSYEDCSQLESAAQLDLLLQQRVTAFHGRDTWQGTFIDNHDQIRTMVRLQKIGVPSETERERRMDLATVLLMTVRGIPIIYYGDEQYLADYTLAELNGYTYSKPNINSFGDDPFNRPGMKSWDENTSAFEIIHILAGLRQSSEAISKGTYTPIYADQDVLIFERIWKDKRVLVAVNRGKSKSITFARDLGFATGRYSGLLTDANDVNRMNRLDAQASSSTIYLNGLSALVVAK